MWIDGLRWMDGWMDIDGWMDDEWTDMDACMDRWMDGYGQYKWIKGRGVRRKNGGMVHIYELKASTNSIL